MTAIGGGCYECRKRAEEEVHGQKQYQVWLFHSKTLEERTVTVEASDRTHAGVKARVEQGQNSHDWKVVTVTEL
jgi:hypothetical protein